MSTVKDKRYFIKTYGCQMNYSDTERVNSVMESLGFSKTKKVKEADIVMFNTCSVRQKAEDKVYGQMRKLGKLRKERPNLLIGLTGCMVRKTSSRNSEEDNQDKLIKKMAELDFVFRIEDLPELPKVINQISETDELPTLDDEELGNYFQIAPKYDSKFQAYLPIMTGCDKFCTYCIVPFSRGREKSRVMKNVVEEAKKLVDSGCKEITLLGQTVNTYGLALLDKRSGKFEYNEGATPFSDLLYELDKLKDQGLQRLRFTSSYPLDFTDSVIDAVANLETVMPYIHLPVQSGSNSMLKKMRRNYEIETYKEIIYKLKDKVEGFTHSTDIIVGFCGETQEEFQATHDLMVEMEYDMVFIAQYSPRKETYSERMMEDDVPDKVKKARWAQLNEVLKASSLKNKQSSLGKVEKVLVERNIDGTNVGYTEGFRKVEFEAGRDFTGKIIDVKITEAHPFLLKGELE